MIYQEDYHYLVQIIDGDTGNRTKPITVTIPGLCRFLRQTDEKRYDKEYVLFLTDCTADTMEAIEQNGAMQWPLTHISTFLNTFEPLITRDQEKVNG